MKSFLIKIMLLMFIATTSSYALSYKNYTPSSNDDFKIKVNAGTEELFKIGSSFDCANPKINFNIKFPKNIKNLKNVFSFVFPGFDTQAER